jgi:hypothetical protein
MTNFRKIKSKKDLVNLQQNFADIIRKPLNSDDTIKPDARARQMISKHKKLKPIQRLEIYAQQYWWRIEQSFDEDFPSIQRVLSEEKYLRLRNQYLLDNPSRSFTLRNLGSKFEKYINIKQMQ